MTGERKGVGVSNNEEELIVLKKSALKKILYHIIKLIITTYQKFDSYSIKFWTTLFLKEKRLSLLVNNKFTRLPFNAVVIAFFGIFFRGLIGELMMGLSFILIFGVLFEKMEWLEKLRD